MQIYFKWNIALCVLLLFLILINLGFWQLDRAEQKRQIQNDRDARRLAIPVSIESLNLDDINTLKHMKVTLSGRFDNAKSILISNQMFQGRPGYEVITLFKLHSSNQIVLVSRGWIAADNASRNLPTIEPVTGTQHLMAEIHVPSSQSFFLSQKIEQAVAWPLRLHHFDMNGISQLFDSPVLPFVARLDQNNAGVLERHWRVTRLQATNSTSYAIQWFAMALILLVITIVKSTNILKIIQSKKSTR